MDINASIVDQMINGIIKDHHSFFETVNDEAKRKASAFVILCMAKYLDITFDEAFELFTDGGNDAGVDGIHIGDIEENEFFVTFFQGKYKINNLEGNSDFPENGVQKAINTVTTLFDPSKKIELNHKIAPIIEEIRSLVRDGYIPNVRIILCNNGSNWNNQAQNLIDQSGLPKDQIDWQHFNHNSIVKIISNTKAVDDSLRFSGKAIVEDFNFRRVFIGKVPVTEIAELFNRNNEALLERNIRKYLGLSSNRVNSAISETLNKKEKRNNFYFFNNGITIICRKFRYNALQGENYQVKLENMHVINGGQTCKTIQETLKNSTSLNEYEDTFVMVRIYELADDDQNFVQDITYATNSQNPVDLRDLRSNDEQQRRLEIAIKDFGYTYKAKREEGGGGSNVVTSLTLAEATLAIWREKPHQAKYRRSEHFGRLYDDIFNNLNAAQALIAIFIFREVENRRKRPETKEPPDFLPYASHYISMLIGKELLRNNQISLSEVSHKNFKIVSDNFEANKNQYYNNAINNIKKGLATCYGERKVSLQQLAATFRRGDLLEILNS